MLEVCPFLIFRPMPSNASPEPFTNNCFPSGEKSARFTNFSPLKMVSTCNVRRSILYNEVREKGRSVSFGSRQLNSR